MSVNCDVYSKMELCRSLSSISKLLPRVLELTEFFCSFLQVDRAQIRSHLRDTNNHDPDGNAWCHLDGCGGTYTAYRLNIWGLQATANRRAGKDKVAQQVVNGNAWCHLDGCGGTYTAYRINIWGLQATTANRRAGKDMVAQQVVNGNAWYHLGGCGGTYTAYRINIWGLQATAINRRAGQGQGCPAGVNLENHLSKAHGTSLCVCVCVY